MKIKIKSAKILDPNSSSNGKVRNVIIQNGKITDITEANVKSDVEIMGKDLKVSPGWVDLWTSFGDPGNEQKEDLKTGLQVASAGGFTGVTLLPNTIPPIQTKNDISYVTSQNASSITQVYPMGSVTVNNEGDSFTEMLDLNDAGANVFSDGLHPINKADILLRTLLYLQKTDGLLINKPGDLSLNKFGVMHEGKMSTILGMKGMPRIAEEIMISRDIMILGYTGGRLHFANISSAGSVDLIRKAKKAGLNVSCDVAVYSLLFDDSSLSTFDSNYKVDPPIREKSDIKALKKGLKDGTIDAITTSHQPQDVESKNMEYDLAEFGMLGLQTFLPMLLSSDTGLSWDEIIQKISINPNSLLQREQSKIEKGETAEITVFSDTEVWEYNEKSNVSKSMNSPLLDQKLKGKVKAVFNNKKHQVFG